MDESHKSNAEKRMSDTRVYTVWFLLYTVQKQEKLIYAVRSQDSRYSGWQEEV